LQPPSPTLSLPQSPEFLKSCCSINDQILESNPPHEHGDISLIAPVQSSTNTVVLSPAPYNKQVDNENLVEIKTKLSKPLDAF
jgi:hypothetical protein